MLKHLPENVGQVAAPEGEESLAGHGPPGAVEDAAVRLVQHALLQHLALVLHQQLHPLDGGGGRLGHAGRHAGEHEVLEETQLGLLLVRHLVGSCPGVLQDNL